MLGGPSRSNLQRLFMLRVVMIIFLLSVTIGLVYLHIPLPRLPILIAMSGLLCINIVTFLRLKTHRTVSENEVLAQLFGDLIALTILFYFTGGYSNPLVWMYLLPLTVASVALKRAFAFLLALIAVICYSILVFYYVPISHMHMHDINGRTLDIHLIGMWLGFVVSAGIIPFFITRISQNLRDYDFMISNARETALESERVLALGTLATAAAHELGTPLATMAVVTREMARDHADQAELTQPLALLQSQIQRCKEILTSMSATAGQTRAEDGEGLALDVFLHQIITRWQDARPSTRLDCTIRGGSHAPVIAADRTLGQALMNLLDNAADASPERIELDASWSGKKTLLELTVRIRDFGAGVAPEIADKIGTPFYTTKENNGLGLGLYLSKLILERFGGTVTLTNHKQTGTIAILQLPLKALLVQDK